MKRMKMDFFGRVLALFFLCVLLSSTSVSAESEWKYIYTKDGIDVFQKSFPGTSVRAFKGIGFVDAKLEVVNAVIRNIPDYPLWVARCREAEILKDIDRDTRIFYSVVDAPSPYKDRDMILENKTVYNLERGSVEIFFHISDQNIIPPKDKYFRVSELSGQYILEYYGRDKTRVIFEYRGSPGGNVPVSIANWLESRHYPHTNIMGLRKMAKKPECIKAGKASPDRELVESMSSDIKQVRVILRNRVSDYIIDSQMVDILFNSKTMQDMIRMVYEQKATFQSIQLAVTGMLYTIVSSPAIDAYINDRKLEDLFSIDMLMQEKWLVGLAAKKRKQIEIFLSKNNRIAEKLFYKITTSDKAVRTLIKNDDLARAILTDEYIRTSLWQDDILRKKILNKIGSFKNLKALENIIKARVDDYIKLDEYSTMPAY